KLAPIRPVLTRPVLTGPVLTGLALIRLARLKAVPGRRQKLKPITRRLRLHRRMQAMTPRLPQLKSIRARPMRPMLTRSRLARSKLGRPILVSPRPTSPGFGSLGLVRQELANPRRNPPHDHRPPPAITRTHARISRTPRR